MLRVLARVADAPVLVPAVVVLAAAAAELAEVLTPSEATPTMPVMFAAASGTRGW